MEQNLLAWPVKRRSHAKKNRRTRRRRVHRDTSLPAAARRRQRGLLCRCPRCRRILPASRRPAPSGLPHRPPQHRPRIRHPLRRDLQPHLPRGVRRRHTHRTHLQLLWQRSRPDGSAAGDEERRGGAAQPQHTQQRQRRADAPHVRRYRIRTVPTQPLFHRGEEHWRRSGITSYEKLAAALEQTEALIHATPH